MIYFMIFLLLSGGMFSAACEVLGLPPIATAKGVRLASKKEESLQDTVTRKGASKKAAIDYIERNAPGLVKDNIINLGTIDNTVPMYIDNDDIKKLIGRIFEYSIYRDEYKHSLNKSIVRH